MLSHTHCILFIFQQMLCHYMWGRQIVVPRFVSNDSCSAQTRILFCSSSYLVLFNLGSGSAHIWASSSLFNSSSLSLSSLLHPTFISRSSPVHYSFSARCALVKVWSRTSAERVINVRSTKEEGNCSPISIPIPYQSQATSIIVQPRLNGRRR